MAYLGDYDGLKHDQKQFVLEVQLLEVRAIVYLTLLDIIQLFSKPSHHKLQSFIDRTVGKPLRSENIRKKVKITLSEDPIEIFLVIRLEDISQQEANESLRPNLATFRNIEYEKLYKFGSLDRQHLILKHQEYLSHDLFILCQPIEEPKQMREEMVEFLRQFALMTLISQHFDLFVLNEGGITSGKGLCTHSSARTSSVSKLTRFSMMISRKSIL